MEINEKRSLGPHSKILDLLNQRYADLPEVKRRIKDYVPGNFPKSDLVALMADLENITSVRPALELFLRTMGKSLFELAFPLAVRNNQPLPAPGG